MMQAVKDWYRLTPEERAFVLRVYKSPRCKCGTEPHYTNDESQLPLWENPEGLGFIKWIGSYKWDYEHKFIQVLFNRLIK